MIGQVWWTIVGLLLMVSVVFRQNLLFLMTLLLALIGGISYLWTRYCLVGVTYRRKFGSDRIFYGEETDLHIEMVNAKPLPLAWLRAEDEFPEEVQLSGGRLYYSHLPRRRLLNNLVSLRWYERVTRHYRLRGIRRGAWEFGPLSLESGDIFGLAIRRARSEEKQTLLVYPKIVPLTSLGLPARRPFGDFKTPQRLVQDPLRPMGTREYQPGDSFRYIHWKASARQPTLQTKVFDPSASRPLAIFLNVNTFEFIWEGLDLELEEFAVTAAASIARYAWEQGYQVGLYVNSVAVPTGERIRLKPSNHPDQFLRILEALARVAEYGRWPIATVLEVEAGLLAYGTTLVVVTALIDDHLCKVLMDMRRREHAVTLVALGEARLESPLPGVQYYHIGGHEEWHKLETLELV